MHDTFRNPSMRGRLSNRRIEKNLPHWDFSVFWRLSLLTGVVLAVTLYLHTHFKNAVGKGENEFLSKASSDEFSEWSACMTEDRIVGGPFSVASFLAAQPAELKVEHLLRSARVRSHQAVTALVVVNMDRLFQLDGFCASWAGVASTAVYVPTLTNQTEVVANASVAAALQDVQAVHQKAELSEQGCQLDILLLSEVVQPGLAELLFPINTLRNFALLGAHTEMVFFTDVDLLAGSTLNEVLASPTGYDEIASLTRSNKLVVVPAFDTQFVEVANEVANGDKQAVKLAWDAKRIDSVNSNWPPGHSDTNYSNWMEADKPYALSNCNPSYEPWYIAARALVAPWDVRYRGYGCDKPSQTQVQLHTLNSTYVVHDQAFMIHRPHAPSSSHDHYVEAQAHQNNNNASTLADEPRTVDLRSTVHGWLQAQQADPDFRTLITPAWWICRQRLSWWQAYSANTVPVRTEGS